MDAPGSGSTADPNIHLQRHERSATLEISRPPLNILDLATIRDILAALEQLATDQALQVLVIRGSDRVFSAGVAVEDHAAARVREALPAFHAVLRQLVEIPAITVASVEGHCLGGGMELAAACDLIVAADTSCFGQPEIKLGCFPPAAAAFYPVSLGHRRTVDLLLSGRTLDGREAERIGFATWTVPADTIAERTAEVVESILAQSGAVTRLTKTALRPHRKRQLEALVETERIYLEDLVATDDMHEGIAAFLEKRRPHWNHS